MNPTGRRLLAWMGTLATAGALAATCGGDVPPVPEDLRRFEDEPVQEARCAACHGPGGQVEDIPATGTELPTDHPTPGP